MSTEKPEESVTNTKVNSSKTVDFQLGVRMDSGMSLFSMSKHVGVTDYFSSPLKKQASLSKYGKIPNIMFLCIEQMQMRALTMEGIFRIPGTHSKIQDARKLLGAGKDVDFSEIDIMTVASIFKLWLRELPTPLIPFSCYSKLRALGGTVTKLTETEKEDWKDNVKRIIVNIPSPEWDCLQVLMIFLNKVAKKSEVNKMHPKNLAIVMAPNIMYKKPPEEDDAKSALANLMLSEDMGPTIEIITVLIQEVEFFFLGDDKHEVSKSEMKNEESEGVQIRGSSGGSHANRLSEEKQVEVLPGSNQEAYTISASTDQSAKLMVEITALKEKLKDQQTRCKDLEKDKVDLSLELKQVKAELQVGRLQLIKGVKEHESELANLMTVITALQTRCKDLEEEKVELCEELKKVKLAEQIQGVEI